MQEGPWPEKAYRDANEHARRRDAARYLDYGASRPRVISQGPYQQHLGDVNDGADLAPASIRESVPKLEPAPTAPSKEKTEKSLEKMPAEEVPALPERKLPKPGSDDLPNLKTMNKSGRPTTAALNHSDETKASVVVPSTPEVRQAGYIQPTASTPANRLR